jgi:hypothetical protein
MFVQKGGEVDFPPPFDFADNTQKYDYLMVPVSLKAVAQPGAVNPFILAGLAAGFLLNNETELKSGETIEGAGVDDLDVTLELGVGADIPAGQKLVFSVEARYSLGLANISSDEIGSTKTRTTLVMGGVSFKL